MQNTPSASYSLTLRIKLINRAGGLGALATAIGRAGGDIGVVDIVNVSHGFMTRDLWVSNSPFSA
jgi:malate dehydrogenase (oxaloacetate-decarboxylating)